jgi:DNA-binding MarR family transcriptional regulator
VASVPRPQPDQTALQLAVAIKRLKVRLREVSGPDLMALPLGQLSLLERLLTAGPATAAQLAVAEHVSQQAIAQSVERLKQAGLVQTDPDPDDRRKNLISVTVAGHDLVGRARSDRNAWLGRAIDAVIPAEDRAALDKAIELLERLADAEP